ncbi:biotin--[acetyl-CoA-carboxylase] ligase [Sutcliffiella rhizosphaerae]|uniref:Bifunctional ligase/repressor BirA n=1 Tax=Sutcliffiella rhizosphaerae TaxID=2880967 RepID=A0ABM8YRK3_9BACI|nr:biotin--[acetyl-CoA-carboxylase] ligase [Sutcliffiella rhizosphaerae]CAG9622627.1 Bifunctional ligase/repressor BirA [Sutcliffiella rhizosphaerae]
MATEIRKKLLRMFTETEDDFLSGQKISEELGCSRTAVWKHIEDLRQEGFELEAVRRKGYRIKKIPDKISHNEITLGLKTTSLGRQVHFKESVTSTQKIAHQLAYDGVPEGTLVVSEEQTTGRGRLNRSWHSPKYTGVWMSLILRPNLPPAKAPQLTLLTAVAITQAIEEVTGLRPDIKWPNDILINKKKAVGILTEMQAEADKINSVIIGMGINVNHQIDHFPKELHSIATSLSIELGKTVNRAELIQSILLHLENLYERYLQHGFYPIKLLWESYAISIGKRIIARTITGTLEGLAKGITEDGILMLEDDQNCIHYIHSADIQIGND